MSGAATEKAPKAEPAQLSRLLHFPQEWPMAFSWRSALTRWSLP